jgi:ribonuclease P protein component
MHVAPAEADQRSSRFGFVVSKAVGNAPTRNLVKRRLRMLARPLADEIQGDVVFRALAPAAFSSWDSLGTDVAQCVSKYERSRA